MKTAICLWMVILLVAGSTTAQAMNREWAAALGFLGGVVVADAWNNRCPPARTEVVVDRPVYIERPVYVERPVVVERRPVRRGHYIYQPRREWVPGCWVHERTRGGRVCRVWQPGYYRTFTVRVWVEEGCHEGWDEE